MIRSYRFVSCNSCDIKVIFEKDFVVIQTINSEENIEDEISLYNDQIKTINKQLNKNKKKLI